MPRKRHYKKRKGLLKGIEWEIEPKTLREVLAIFSIIFGGLFLLSLLGLAGSLGQFLSQFIRLLFGYLSPLFSLTLLFLGFSLFFPKKIPLKATSSIGLVLFFLFLPSLVHLFIDKSEALEVAKMGKGGGIIGFSLSFLFNSLIGFWGSLLILLGLSLVSLLVIFQASLSSLFSGFFRLIKRKKPEVLVHKPGIPVLSMMKRKPQEVEEKPLPGEYQLPTPDLLEDISSSPTPGDINKNVSIIAKTLRNFGILVTMSDVNIGPTVTQYTLKPSEGVKLANITARANDLALTLASHPIRIEAPIPGKAFVGIEVPNQKRALVTLKEMLLTSEWKNHRCKLPITLGRDVAGTPTVVNLEKMPHLLISGATGTGKTIAINSIIMSLLYTKKPDELKFILIDPKRVEFTHYNNLPHLLAPVVVDLKEIVSTLKWTVAEMERRYKIFQEAHKRDIDVYNTEIEEKMPYIIVIIDELADLMAMAASDVEASIVRIAQMARAVGIHLVVATQRPSVDVITGLIKANITSRVAFAVASQVDSRTILDMAGAEKLLGEGDMLYQASDVAKPRRIQGVMIKEKEVKKVTDFIKVQVPSVSYQKEVIEFRPKEGFAEIPPDELYEEALKVVVEAQKASASLLQRRLRVGYARAARLLDLLEQKGIIGPQEGSKPREILRRPEEINESP